MSEAQISPILAALALAAAAGSIALAASIAAPGAYNLRALLLARGRWLAFLVPAVAMSGSLYYSEIAHFIPCEFCWYQRIAMYPLAVILLIAAITKDAQIWKYAVPIAVIGLALSTYHYQLQLFPNQASTCSQTAPCHAFQRATASAERSGTAAGSSSRKVAISRERARPSADACSRATAYAPFRIGPVDVTAQFAPSAVHPSRSPDSKPAFFSNCACAVVATHAIHTINALFITPPPPGRTPGLTSCCPGTC